VNRRVALAVVLLTATLIRRFLREGFVLRSLVWPAGLAAGTLLMTLLVVAMVKESQFIGVPADLDPALVERLQEEGWTPKITDDLEATMRARQSWAATDGTVMWRNWRPESLRLESILRERKGAKWRPEADVKMPTASEAAPQGALFTKLVAILFTLYGVVFGLGMVARDRDDGSLEAELALPLPHWVAGATRWLAATSVLSLFFSFSVVLFDAIIGVEQGGALIRHGIAATGGATALGLIAVGKAGIKQGFSGPLAGGLTGAMGVMGVGLAMPQVGSYLPLASLFAGGSGWIPVAIAMGLGVVASAVFSFRSARS